MPSNKDALIRYRVINRCLIEKRYVTRSQLREACERALDISPIGERTIDADINAMRNDARLGYFAPIKMDRRRGVYYYEDPNYSIDKIPLREEEIDSIMVAARLLEQYGEVEVFRRFGESARKIRETVRVYRSNMDSFESLGSRIEFERAEWLRGSEFLEPLIDAVRNNVVQRISYKSFTSDEVTFHELHPYLLKEYRNRWYVVGYNGRYGDIRTYCLDRIVSREDDYAVRFVDTGFDAVEYYRNVIGVSVLNRKPEKIVLEFSERQAQYVITQPLHGSQERIDADEGIFWFRYYLVPNFEFYAAILSYGDEVKVLKPASVRKQLLKILEETIRRYADK